MLKEEAESFIKNSRNGKEGEGEGLG